MNVKKATDLKANDYVTFKTGATLKATAATPLTGGTNAAVDGSAHQKYLDKIESYTYNTMGVVTTEETIKTLYTSFCKRLRELDAFREKCYYCDACGGRKARRIGKAYVYICHAGLIDFAIPIMIKGQYVGAFLE